MMPEPCPKRNVRAGVRKRARIDAYANMCLTGCDDQAEGQIAKIPKFHGPFLACLK